MTAIAQTVEEDGVVSVSTLKTENMVSSSSDVVAQLELQFTGHTISMQTICPSSLEELLSKSSWIELLSRMDEALVPLNMASKTFLILKIVTISLIILLSLLQMLQFLQIMPVFPNYFCETKDYFGYHCERYKNPNNYIPIFFFILSFWVIVPHYWIRPTIFKNKRDEFLDKAENVCEEFSRMNSNLTFHLNFNQYPTRMDAFVKECSIIVKTNSSDPNIFYGSQNIKSKYLSMDPDSGDPCSSYVNTPLDRITGEYCC